jgi:benzoate-CoA ligase
MEIETVLLRHELVVEVAVVGYRTAEGLEKPRAFIVLDDPAQASDGLKEEMKVLVQSELAIYKYPRSIEFVDELPRTTTGKLQRYRLRE